MSGTTTVDVGPRRCVHDEWANRAAPKQAWHPRFGRWLRSMHR